MKRPNWLDWRNRRAAWLLARHGGASRSEAAGAFCRRAFRARWFIQLLDELSGDCRITVLVDGLPPDPDEWLHHSSDRVITYHMQYRGKPPAELVGLILAAGAKLELPE